MIAAKLALGILVIEVHLGSVSIARA